MTKKLSAVVVSYNMARELPRTLRTLSPAMQRGVRADDYEVIVVDNGSTVPFDEDACRRLLPGLIIHRVESPTPSPVRAVNLGLAAAEGDLVGVFIDGARMASPGLLATALKASRLHPRPVIGALSFHLGPEVQMTSVHNGYNQAVEDALLASCGWEEDAYRLFDVSVLAGSSVRGWFCVPAETNSLFLTATHWREMGGYDPAFTTPGGGMANLDIWERLCADPTAEVIMMLGEATFHQVHGGVTTNALVPSPDRFYEEYARIRGRPFVPPDRTPLLLGSPPIQAQRWIGGAGKT